MATVSCLGAAASCRGTAGEGGPAQRGTPPRHWPGASRGAGRQWGAGGAAGCGRGQAKVSRQSSFIS